MEREQDFQDLILNLNQIIGRYSLSSAREPNLSLTKVKMAPCTRWTRTVTGKSACCSMKFWKLWTQMILIERGQNLGKWNCVCLIEYTIHTFLTIAGPHHCSFSTFFQHFTFSFYGFYAYPTTPFVNWDLYHWYFFPLKFSLLQGSIFCKILWWWASPLFPFNMDLKVDNFQNTEYIPILQWENL